MRTLRKAAASARSLDIDLVEGFWLLLVEFLLDWAELVAIDDLTSFLDSDLTILVVDAASVLLASALATIKTGNHNSVKNYRHLWVIRMVIKSN